MAKTIIQYICQSCGAATSKWAGRCDGCGTWNSLVETAVSTTQRSAAGGTRAMPVKIGSVDAAKRPRLATGIGEFDRVLGGGIVPGALILLSGDPGIGKSTIALQVVGAVASGQAVLYVSGEESDQQIKLRADRLGLGQAQLDLLTDTNAEAVAAAIEQGGYKLAIIDSIQTMATEALTGAAGSVGQITASAQLLQSAAKRSHTALVIVGHVTKEGNIAGPKVLEHLVDVVLYLEGERSGGFKALRGIKNRFGATSEVGIFEMTEAGLVAVPNPSAALLAERQPGPGSVVLATLEGSRPLLVEVQALVATTVFGYPKRTAAGFDLNRLNLLVAVLSKRAGLNLSNQDVYVNIVGGLKITEPAADLAIILSIASAYKNLSFKRQMAVFGEVGLNGEIRSVSNIQKRVTEAKSLGLAGSIGPKSPTKVTGLDGVATVREAIAAALES